MFRLRFLQHIPWLPVVIGFIFSLALAGTAQSPTASEAPAGFTTPSGCPLEPYPPGIGTCSSNGLAEPAGDGFVEAVDSNTLFAIANNQPSQSGGRIAGEFIQVTVSEAPGHVRGGRFGWKNQHASLLSFAADAYLNEMGITSRFAPTDVTSVCKVTSDPEDHADATGLTDIDRFAQFMRATNAPPRDTALAATADAQAGAQLFSAIGCNICHLASIATAPAGTVINGGALAVPAALGSKVIHPYSDFLLHNVGTGDGVVQNGPADTANKMRTAPLWGVRTRDRLMHDGESLTRNEAILRHAGEATFVINNYRSLTTTQKNQLITFLNSL